MFRSVQNVLLVSHHDLLGVDDPGGWLSDPRAGLYSHVCSSTHACGRRAHVVEHDEYVGSTFLCVSEANMCFLSMGLHAASAMSCVQ